MFSSSSSVAPQRKTSESSRTAADIPERALAFARKHHTQLTPEVFEVWYTYAARDNPQINEALDRAMNTGQVLDVDYLTKLYSEHLSPQSGGDALDRIGGDLHGTLSRVSDALGENLKEHSVFSGTLRNAGRHLAQGSSKGEISGVIRDLHRANQQHLQAAQKLGLQLEKSRSQVAKLKSELVEVKRNSNTDYLTGLPNRRALDEVIDIEIFDARQKKHPLSLMMCAIDNLESVTRTHGLSAGDETMKTFADITRRVLRPGQTPSRFAGARFAIVLPELEPVEALQLAEALRQRFRELDGAKGMLGQLSISVGVTQLLEGDDRTSLVDRTDRNLTTAQGEGRDRSVMD